MLRHLLPHPTAICPLSSSGPESFNLWLTPTLLATSLSSTGGRRPLPSMAQTTTWASPLPSLLWPTLRSGAGHAALCPLSWVTCLQLTPLASTRLPQQSPKSPLSSKPQNKLAPMKLLLGPTWLSPSALALLWQMSSSVSVMLEPTPSCLKSTRPVPVTRSALATLPTLTSCVYTQSLQVSYINTVNLPKVSPWMLDLFCQHNLVGNGMEVGAGLNPFLVVCSGHHNTKDVLVLAKRQATVKAGASVSLSDTLEFKTKDARFPKTYLQASDKLWAFALLCRIYFGENHVLYTILLTRYRLCALSSRTWSVCLPPERRKDYSSL